MANGTMNFNELGICSIADAVPENTAKQINEKMDELIKKHIGLAQIELDEYLDSLGLESVMGVIFPKSQVTHF